MRQGVAAAAAAVRTSSLPSRVACLNFDGTLVERRNPRWLVAVMEVLRLSCCD